MASLYQILLFYCLSHTGILLSFSHFKRTPKLLTSPAFIVYRIQQFYSLTYIAGNRQSCLLCRLLLPIVYRTSTLLFTLQENAKVAYFAGFYCLSYPAILFSYLHCRKPPKLLTSPAFIAYCIQEFCSLTYIAGKRQSRLLRRLLLSIVSSNSTLLLNLQEKVKVAYFAWL